MLNFNVAGVGLVLLGGRHVAIAVGSDQFGSSDEVCSRFSSGDTAAEVEAHRWCSGSRNSRPKSFILFYHEVFESLAQDECCVGRRVQTTLEHHE